MTDIRFIRAQGDLLDAAILKTTAEKPVRTPPRSGWSSRPRPRGRSAIIAIGVALLIAGCAVAVASGVLGSSQRLAVGNVDCYYATGITTPGSPLRTGPVALIAGVPLPAGEAPTAFCAREIRQSFASLHHSVGVATPRVPRLVACVKNASTAAVYIASGATDQCQQLGLRPLPSDFQAASASVRALASQLDKLYVSRDCWPPAAFTRAARQALAQHGLSDWRVVVSRPHVPSGDAPFGLGRCVQFTAAAPNSESSPQSLNGVNRTVTLGLSIPRSLDTLINHLDDTLYADTSQHCYSRASIRTLVDRTFASTGMTPQIAITTNPNGGDGFSYGNAAENRRYARNCPILFESWPTLSGRTILVWLNARNGTYLRPGTAEPPLADFHRS